MKILVAEDDAFAGHILNSALRKAGHQVTLCADGEIAIEMLDGKNSFDVVITDMIMPNADGIAVMSHIKEQGLSIPVLAISAGDHENPDDYLAYASYFATDTLAKPVKKDELLKAVNNLSANSGYESLFL